MFFTVKSDSFAIVAPPGLGGLLAYIKTGEWVVFPTADMTIVDGFPGAYRNAQFIYDEGNVGGGIETLEFTDWGECLGDIAPTRLASITSFTADLLEVHGGHFAPNDMALLETISLNSLWYTLYFEPSNLPSLITLSIPALTSVPGDCAPHDLDSLTTLDFGLLTDCNSFYPYNMSSLTSLILTNFTHTQESFYPHDLPLLTVIDLPAFTHTIGGYFYPNNMAALISLTLNAATILNAGFAPNNMDALTTLGTNNLEFINSSCNPNNMDSLETLSFPVLWHVGLGFYPYSMASLTSISIPLLERTMLDFGPSLLDSLVTLSAPSLTFVGGYLMPSNMLSLTTMSFPVLDTALDGIVFSNFPLLSSVDFSSLRWAIIVGIYFENCPSLTTLSFPAIEAVAGGIWFTTGMENLTSFSLGPGLMSINNDVYMTSPSLNVTSVDNLLVGIAKLDGTGGTYSFIGNTVNLTGNCAPPSVIGLAAKAIIEARGNTVLVN